MNLFVEIGEKHIIITEILSVKIFSTHPIPGAPGFTRISKLSGIDSARRMVDKNGIFAADVVVVPLEDGDRTMALRKAGKIVITFDLNPLSRTSQTASITIVDNVTRAIDLLIDESKKLSKKNQKFLQKIVNDFDNKKNLTENIIQIKNNLTRRARIA